MKMLIIKRFGTENDERGSGTKVTVKRAIRRTGEWENMDKVKLYLSSIDLALIAKKSR